MYQKTKLFKMSKGAEYAFLQRKYTDGQKEKALIIANHQENANKNRHEKPPYHMSDGLLSKIKQITRIGEDVGKRDPLYTVEENVN